MSTWSTCGFHSQFFRCFVRQDHSLRTQTTQTVCGFCFMPPKQNPVIPLCSQASATSWFCCYVIGLFNRPQADHKHNRKGMWFGCEQPFLCGGALRDIELNSDPVWYSILLGPNELTYFRAVDFGSWHEPWGQDCHQPTNQHMLLNRQFHMKNI